jgi:DNA polymerase-3 subunit delta
MFVVKGSDPSLVDRGVTRLVAELTSDARPPDGADDDTPQDRALAVAVEEHRIPATSSQEDDLIGPVIDALFTPAFLADRRIVVLRDTENLDAKRVEQLVSRLSEPFAPNVLVLAIANKALPASLAKVCKERARQIDTSPGTSAKERSTWLGEQFRSAPIHLEPATRHMLEEHLGEDLPRLNAVLDVLTAAYGSGARISPEDLEPFLGEEGGTPPWELTDALNTGDTNKAMDVTHRMLGGGGRHPFQLLATLHKHYGAMLRLDRSGVANADEAASLLHMAPYPARKILAQGRSMGPERVAKAVSLIADADFNLRGVLDWPNSLVIEVLVARLAQLSPRPSGASAASSRAITSAGARHSGTRPTTSR